jgi:hypothetical protein
MADTPDERDDDQPLSERFLDLFVFLPTGVAVTLAEELPRLAERGRERLGVQVNSARAVGRFVVHAGSHELKKRSEGLKRTSSADTGRTARPSAPPAATGTTAGRPPRLRSIPRPPTVDSPAPVERPAPGPAVAPPETTPSAATTTTASAPARPAGGNVPDVASLAIPGFDTLSASQVVQRLDGLGRSELVAVRAYETSRRGRRTILSRVDQLLDERS